MKTKTKNTNKLPLTQLFHGFLPFPLLATSFHAQQMMAGKNVEQIFNKEIINR